MKLQRTAPISALTVAALLSLLGTAPAAGQESPPVLQAGVLAPDFASKDLGGRDVRLADFKGKVVVLDFWATWCGPCLQSLPHVQEIAKANKEAGVVVLAVCTSDTRAKYEEWLKGNQDKYPDLVFSCEVHDRGADLFDERASHKLYRVSGLPTKFVVGRDGKIALTIVGDEKGDVRLEAGLARAGIAIDAAVAQKGEAQVKKVAAEDAERIAEATANPPPAFFPQAGRLKAGDAMPDFTLVVGPDGKETKFSALRGKPVVLTLTMAEVPVAKLQEVQKRYGHYGVQVLAAVVASSRADYETWLEKNRGKFDFAAGCDPVGKFTGDAADAAARQAHHQRSVLGQLFGMGMYPGMPAALVVDAEGRFAGMFPFGPRWTEGLGNLLLHCGVELTGDDLPKKVAPAEAFVVKAPPPPEPKVDAIQVGAVAPDFITTDLAKKTVQLADYRGKVVVLDFWATWCGPCKAALPHTQEIADHYKNQDVVVLASCTSDERAAFDRWVKQNQEKYPDIVFAHDAAEKSPDRASRKLYGVSGIPMQFVIGKDGKIAATVSGYTAGEVLLEAALTKAGVKVEQAVLDKAAEDEKQRAARSGKTVPALPLGQPRK